PISGRSTTDLNSPPVSLLSLGLIGAHHRRSGGGGVGARGGPGVGAGRGRGPWRLRRSGRRVEGGRGPGPARPAGPALITPVVAPGGRLVETVDALCPRVRAAGSAVDPVERAVRYATAAVCGVAVGPPPETRPAGGWDGVDQSGSPGAVV